MRTIKYKTLKGLLKNNVCQMNYNQYHEGIIYKRRFGWCRFELPEDERMKGYKLLAGYVYANADKGGNILANYNGEHHGIFRRLFFTLRNGVVGATYCAGQDYTSEIRTLQRLFRA